MSERFFVFHCPLSEECDEGRHRQKYPNRTKEKTLWSATNHLYSSPKHNLGSWENAEAKAKEGISAQDCPSEKFIDPEGRYWDAYKFEQRVASLREPTIESNEEVGEEAEEDEKGGGKASSSGKGGKGKGGKGRHGGKGGKGTKGNRKGDGTHRRDWHRDSPDRGRGRENLRIEDRGYRRGDSRERSRTAQVIAVPRAPGSDEVLISRHELDSLIDSNNRSLHSLKMMQEFLEGAVVKVKSERRVIEQCIFALERYKRSCM